MVRRPARLSVALPVALSAAALAATLSCPATMSAQTTPQTPAQTPAQTASESSPQLSLMPLPSSVSPADGSFAITPQLTVALTGVHSPRLQAAVLRTLRRLEDKTGTPLPRAIDSHATSGTVTVKVSTDIGVAPTLTDNESYSLTITPSSVTIDAGTTLGALHALETLVQLTQPAPAGNGNSTGYVVPAVTIQDSPRFRWRGLMIDCGRHFEPLDVLKRNLDAMAAVKLNVFHWHLTEDQGFRIESKVFPKLTGVGSNGLFYTQDDVRELVRYAADRGIRVVPEFEMPGHSAAWLFAYPELSSGTNPDAVRTEFGISDTAIDPTREETYRFIQRFLAEMVPLFPDQYIHIGGDETPAPDWKKNPRILSFMKAHNLDGNEALQAYFNQRVLKILTGLNRKMVGWDEILNPALPKSIVIQSWRGEASLAKGASEGYQGVLSAPYYLDAMKPSSQMYLADPIPADTKLSASEQKLILGGEVAMWAEQLDQRSLDSRIWPRTAAIAERFWSAQSVRDVDSMYRRLNPTSVELESLGLHHLSSEDAGLRSLIDSPSHVDLLPLRTFAEALEPVSFSDRYEEQHTSQLTALTGFVDAVVPDPPIRHQLELAARTLIKVPYAATPRDGVTDLTHQSAIHARQTLTAFFQSVGSSVPEVRRMATASPRLQPLQTRIDQTPALTQAGLEAVSYLTSGTPAPTGWKAKNLALIEEAKKPSAIVRFTFLAPLTDLINAVPDASH